MTNKVAKKTQKKNKSNKRGGSKKVSKKVSKKYRRQREGALCTGCKNGGYHCGGNVDWCKCDDCH
uniref:Uncharacterized protein n=1 Tax=viral metagenome TaxID=1070528 RepID=A0A6C0EA74_9ZZZZ